MGNDELIESKSQRDFYFHLKNQYDDNMMDHKTKAHDLYYQLRTAYQKLNNVKMKNYYANKDIKHFKKSKNFWKFYSVSHKINIVKNQLTLLK